MQFGSETNDIFAAEKKKYDKKFYDSFFEK